MHRKTNLIYALLFSAATASQVCQPGEIGIGTETSVDSLPRGQQPAVRGVIFDHDCNFVTFSNKATWWEGDWHPSAMVETQQISENYFAPTKIQVASGTYGYCYNAISKDCNEKATKPRYVTSVDIGYCCTPDRVAALPIGGTEDDQEQQAEVTTDDFLSK